MKHIAETREQGSRGLGVAMSLHIISRVFPGFIKQIQLGGRSFESCSSPIYCFRSSAKGKLSAELELQANSSSGSRLNTIELLFEPIDSHTLSILHPGHPSPSLT